MARFVGIVATVVGSGYLAWSIAGRPSFKIKDRRFTPPSLAIAITQIGTACLEWGFASAALYFLLPAETQVSYWHFVAIYVIGYVAGMISQAPGGIGVFEAMLLLLLPEATPKDALLAAVLTYRALYFFLPFLIALAMMSGSEVRGFARAARKAALTKRRQNRHSEFK